LLRTSEDDPAEGRVQASGFPGIAVPPLLQESQVDTADFQSGNLGSRSLWVSATAAGTVCAGPGVV